MSHQCVPVIGVFFVNITSDVNTFVKVQNMDYLFDDSLSAKITRWVGVYNLIANGLSRKLIIVSCAISQCVQAPRLELGWVIEERMHQPSSYLFMWRSNCVWIYVD